MQPTDAKPIDFEEEVVTQNATRKSMLESCVLKELNYDELVEHINHRHPRKKIISGAMIKFSVCEDLGSLPVV